MSLKINENLSVQQVLGFSPQDKRAEFEGLAPGWNLIPQVESDLGTRMKCFFDQLFAVSNGEDTSAIKPGDATTDHLAILIGSDTPLLPGSIVEQAYSALASHDVVLGPSHDGGYYLIGARNRTPDIFDDVDWSTEKVLQQTQKQLDEKRISYCLLPQHRDIDDIEDLKFMLSQLKKIDSIQEDQQLLMSTIETALQDAATNRTMDQESR